MNNLVLAWFVNCVISSNAANEGTPFSKTDTKFYVKYQSSKR